MAARTLYAHVRESLEGVLEEGRVLTGSSRRASAPRRSGCERRSRRCGVSRRWGRGVEEGARGGQTWMRVRGGSVRGIGAYHGSCPASRLAGVSLRETAKRVELTYPSQVSLVDQVGVTVVD